MSALKRYRVFGTVTISVSAEVRATSSSEARKLANQLPMMGLCAQCAEDGHEGEWRTSGELDGQPEAERVEVIR